jgi:tetratricopeptide (TPR) repeat protein
MENVTLSHTLQGYYDKALAAIDKSNFDYAIELLLQVVQEEPMHALARKNLRLAERSKLEEAPYTVVTLILLKLNSLLPLIMGLFYESCKQYEKALAFYEEVLKHFPNDTSILIKIAQLSMKKKWTDVAIVAYEDLIEVKPKKLDYVTNVAYLYKQKCDVPKAKYYFEQALKIDPNEQNIKKDLKDLDALTSIQQGNWDDRGSFQTKLKTPASGQSQPLAGALAESLAGSLSGDESDAAAEKKITELEGLLIENPLDERALFKLVALYKQFDRLEKAQDKLKILIETYPNNTKYQETLTQISDLYYLKIINKLNEKLSFEPNNAELKAELERVLTLRRNDEISQYGRRIQFYPNDLGLRYELGLLLYEKGDYNAAVSQFQLAVKDPSKITASLNKLGLCFKAKQMYDLAVEQFRKALGNETTINAVTKDIIYNLGETYELMGKHREAFEEYKKIYGVDISYRDVAVRIDRFYKEGKA